MDDTRDIKVIGIGGCGCNVVNRILDTGGIGSPDAAKETLSLDLEHEANHDIHFIAMNTNQHALGSSLADTRIFLGGEGIVEQPSPMDVKRFVKDGAEEIRQAITGAGMVILIAGMGGGTGTGATPAVARIARELGILTLGFVTTPFSFEGKKRIEEAERGVRELAGTVDTLVVIPNDKLFESANPNTSIQDAFHVSDEVVRLGVRTVMDTFLTSGSVNLALKDVDKIVRAEGIAYIENPLVLG
ncbi:hypothetical protein [Parasphaerochaeta coccoides]|uniref:Tubulin/FtsZ GTPase n=1 Tax=Parasphaerochaeta coccoides (strain ATCC BAA-1237 / DSM 17374 / SPN1) TaxID=760011 RepID=F4GIB7_PARC1|nr:hypothetical protein [Parasphaerochaeta coccoides]AEC01276.1 Tubulin/FtsZ GTPase [Parasphaerochaeta coccoides DSM 17374]